MRIIFHEKKVTDGDYVTISPSRIGEIEMCLRQDGSYVCWMEYSCEVGAVVNGGNV